MPYCAELRDNAAERTASVLSSVLATRSLSGEAMAAPPLRELLHHSVALLLHIQTWAAAPSSSAECRAALQTALRRLTPLCDANRSKYADVLAMAQQLQAVLCGSTTSAAFDVE